MNQDNRLEKALSAKRESKYVEFKEEFDPTAPGAWQELIKDLVAIANSGGGALIVGLANGGRPSGKDATPLIDLDPAVMTDKISKYTGKRFTDFRIMECAKEGQRLGAVLLDAAQTPFVFEKPGTYTISRPGEKQKQKTAFGQGTVYIRHSAKSEPATTDDLRQILERRVEEIRKQWLAGVRKVVRAPEGASLHVLPAGVVQSADPSATPIRIVDDPDAPPYHILDSDKTHPYRQTEAIREINARLPSGVAVNQFDILAVRTVHDIDKNEGYCHSPKYGTRQYSDAFVTWLVDQHRQDPDFFLTARLAYRSSREQPGT